jgi:hypothetical protein
LKKKLQNKKGIIIFVNNKKNTQESLVIMKRIIKYLKEVVNRNEGELILDLAGIVLDTCDDNHDDNLIVTELTTKIDGKLYGNTNWGLVDLEATITDNDDWYTLEEIVGEL